jgi:MFS family permease
MSNETPRLFTARLLVMCGFYFMMCLSYFQLLSTVPFRIRDLGGTTFAAGLFLGFLTYAAACSAPITGAIADRIGRRRTLLVASSVNGLCFAGYGLFTDYRLLLVVVIVHGIFWSALQSASAAHVTDMVPARRRAEGIAYWSLSAFPAMAIGPPIAFWIYERGWILICLLCGALNVAMAVTAWTLQDLSTGQRNVDATPPRFPSWRMFMLTPSIFLYSYGYGAVTTFSAVYADAIGIRPKSLYLTTLGIALLVTRPLMAAAADRIGHRRVLVSALAMMASGLALLAARGTVSWLVASAIVFGVGLAGSYPALAGYLMRDTGERQRGAVFGTVFAAGNTGVGTGSSLTGWVIQHFGFRAAFGTAAALAAISLLSFILVDRKRR